MALSEEKKRHIESLPLQEMAYEINLGNRSRFQREKFAYLKSCYESRLREINSIQDTTPEPTANSTDQIHYWYQKPIGLIGIGVAIVIIGAISVYLIRSHIGIPL
jgi:hypothetical protein